MLSTRNTEADIAGLRAGQMTTSHKTIWDAEFLARVEALIRRNRTPVAPAYLDYGDSSNRCNAESVFKGNLLI